MNTVLAISSCFCIMLLIKDSNAKNLGHEGVDNSMDLEDSTYSSQNVGSTYVLWGRNRCPEGSTLVYDGYAAGKKWDVNGGGANYLCLVKTPEYTDLTSVNVGRNLYGVETDINGFDPAIVDQDMSCAICFTPGRTSVLMVPGMKSCPKGWKQEYWGYLMANGVGSAWQPSQYICADNEPVGVPGGYSSNDQSVMSLVGAMCGSLKCSKYTEGKPLTCVVCSL